MNWLLSVRLKYIHFFLLCAVIVACSVSCASTPAKPKNAGDVSGTYVPPPEPPAAQPETVIAPAVPVRHGYFYNIDEKIIADVENGSPASLRKAVDALRSPGGEQSQNAKVLIATAAGIMQLVWKSEKCDWEAPAVTDETPYLGAIDSARHGIYDMSTGNTDFLTMELPSLVIPGTDSVSELFPAAEHSLLSCIEMRPSSVLANYLLGLLYQKRGNDSTAVLYFATAATGFPQSREIMYAQAVSLNRMGKQEDAAPIAAALLSKNPSDIPVLKLCAEIAFARKDYTSAEDYVARVLQQDPNDRPYVLFRAQILVEKNDYVRAASLLDVYSREDSTSRDYLLLRARIQRDWSKNTSAAVGTIESALAKYPNDVEVLLFASRLAAETGNPVGGRTAEQLAETVLATEPDNVAALENAVQGMAQAGNWQKAYASNTSLLEKDPHNRTFQFMQIRICLALGKKDEAWNRASGLYRDDPNDVSVLETYITVLAGTGRTAQALSLINDKIPSSDSRFKSFLYYRRSLLDSSQDDALTDLRSSLIANPRNNDALFRLYQIYYDRRDYRKAQYYLKQVVALNPDDASLRKLNDDLTRLIK